MKIYFSHGKKGTPSGLKITKMANLAKKHDFATEIIDYTDTYNPDERAKRLTQIIKQEKGDYILVGSSMGAYISLVVSELAYNKPKGLFLLAPALYLPEYKVQTFNPEIRNIEVIHGWNDSTVPYPNSVRFCEEGKHALHLLDSNHRLESATQKVMQIFEGFLTNCKNN